MPIIPRVEGGFWFVVLFAVLIAAGTVFDDSNAGGQGVLGRLGNRLALLVIMVPFGVAFISFMGGCALSAYKVYLYLKLGTWPPFMLGQALYVVDVAIPQTSWVGADLLVADILSWSGIAGLMLVIPIAIAVLMLALWLLIGSLVKAFQ